MVRNWIPENSQSVTGCGSVRCPLLLGDSSELWAVCDPSPQVETSIRQEHPGTVIVVDDFSF